ncbi:MAG: RNA polymerase sigma factor [Pirellulaceae bacterium]
MATMRDADLLVTESDDQTLVQQARKGSREAFEQLVLRHQVAVRSMLWRLLGNQQDVDDVAQEVFLSLLKSVVRFKEQSSFRTWLLSITRNKAITYLRARQRSPHTTTEQIEQLVIQRQIATVMEGGGDPVELEALERCLAQLGESHQKLIRQIYFEGRRAAEVAASMGQASNAIRMKLMRVRKALASCVRKQTG